ncbi:unnamed protein product [Cylicocyclus nassatus]|uniref:Uncharacterized protein n=1 Tax=Cylicocyclus nassatus TaxID=53992 RepID=A0AA36H656_CYLNA|nr:unnamed protein product [Cylicocyclus nassatus]
MSTNEDRELSRKLAVAVVDVINRQLKDVSHLCAKLFLRELLDAKKLVSNEDLLKYKNVKDKDGFVPDLSGDTKTAFAHYQIKLLTKPGNAIYEKKCKTAGRQQDSNPVDSPANRSLHHYTTPPQRIRRAAP